MSQTYTNVEASVGIHAAKPYNRGCKTFQLRSALAAVARKMWPRYTEFELAVAAGAKPDAARKWVDSKATMSGDALASLLRSDSGHHFLNAIMGDAEPAWWPKFKREMEREALRIEAERLRQKIDNLAQELDA